jgi:hypothetical protein
MCQKKRYFIPFFLQSELKTEKAVQKLTPEMKREVDNYFLTSKTKISDLVPGHPYIMGSFTHNRILKMKKVIEFLLMLDPKRAKVLEATDCNEKLIQ